MRTIFSFGLLLSVFSIENASGTARMIARAGGEAATGFVRASATPEGGVQSLRAFWEEQKGNSFVKHTEQKILDLNTKLYQKPPIPPKKIGLLQTVQGAGLTASPLDQSLNPGSHSATPLTKKVTLHDVKNNYPKDLSQQELDLLKKVYRKTEAGAQKDAADQGTGRAMVIDYEAIREKPLLTRVGSNILSLVKRAAQKIVPQKPKT